MAVDERVIEAQDRLVAGVEEAQTRMLDIHKQVAGSMTQLIPSNLPTVPGLEQLPSPAAMVDNYYDFAGKLAEANRAFFKEVFTIWMPENTGTTTEA